MERRGKGSRAAQLVIQSQEERVYAEALGTADNWLADMSRNEAERIATPARKELTPEECAIIGVASQPAVADGKLVTKLRDTSYAPNSVTAHAALERNKLSQEAGSLDMAMDVAATIEPQDSLERLLAHQMAATHVHAMRLMAAAGEMLDASQSARNPHFGQQSIQHASPYVIEAARMTNAAARMMASFQDGVQTLMRKRHGGQQAVVVTHQYVQVSNGGQAVVNGQVNQRKGRGR